MKYLLFSFAISFFILVLDGYFQFFNGYNIFGWKIIGTRISSFFKDELILGSYLSRLFPIFFALFIYFVGNKNKFFSFLFFLLFISIDVLVFLSGERAAFFFINVSAFFIIILSSNYKLYRFLSFIFSLMCIILISINSPKFKEKIIDHTLNQTGFGGSHNKIKVFSLEHQNHYISALRMFQDNKIFGIGTKLFRKNCDKEIYKVSFESCTTHPHNTYIQLLSETGILGFGVVFLIFCIKIYYLIKHWVLKIFYKKILFNDFQLSLLLATLITLWPFIPSGNFFNNWLSVIYYFPISIFLWSLNQKPDNSTKI